MSYGLSRARPEEQKLLYLSSFLELPVRSPPNCAGMISIDSWVTKQILRELQDLYKVFENCKVQSVGEIGKQMGESLPGQCLKQKKGIGDLYVPYLRVSGSWEQAKPVKVNKHRGAVSEYRRTE